MKNLPSLEARPLYTKDLVCRLSVLGTNVHFGFGSETTDLKRRYSPPKEPTPKARIPLSAKFYLDHLLIMHFSSLFTAAGVLQAAIASPIESLEERQVVGGPCHNVHVFTARGSFEGYSNGDNRQDRLVVPGVCKGRNSCGYEDVVYPATIGNDYCGSQTQGVNNGLRQINEFANRCPQSEIVLTGYSQGAQVIGDILGSGGGPTCNAGNVPLNPNQSPGSKSKNNPINTVLYITDSVQVNAITLFGDTRRTPGQGYNKGSAGADAVGVGFLKRIPLSFY